MSPQKITSKVQQKIWPQVEVPCKLADVLNMLTKDELTIIRQNLDLPGLSTLRKPELISALVAQMPEGIAKSLNLLDEERYRFIKRITEKGGWVASSTADSDYLGYFLRCSLLFPGTYQGQKVFFIPQELQEVIIEADTVQFRRQLRSNTEVIRLIHGMLYFYGVMETSRVLEIIKDLTGEQPNWMQFYGLLRDSMDCYEQIHWEDGYLCDYRVQDAKWVIREQLARPSIEFYPFTKAQLIKAGAPNYLDATPQVKSLLNLLASNYELDEDELVDIADDLLAQINNDEQLGDLITFLGDFLEFPSLEVLQAITSAVVDVANNARKWILKGYTSDELSQRTKRHLRPVSTVTMARRQVNNRMDEEESNVFDIRTKAKIGRNDPCPCGSGEKFKKCCWDKDE